MNRLENGLVLDFAELGTSGLVPLELVDCGGPELARQGNSGGESLERTLGSGPPAPIRGAGRLVPNPVVGGLGLEGAGLLLRRRELLVVVLALVVGIDEYV